MVNLNREDLKDELDRLDREKFSNNSKNIIKKFVNDMLIKEQLSENRLMSYVSRLRQVARWIPDKFLKPDVEAINVILSKLAEYGENGKDPKYSEWTRETYINMIKRFYKWHLGNNKTYPDFLDGIKRPKNHNNIEPEQLITKDELDSLVNNSVSARDKAIFTTLYDSGVRIGELLTMRIKDLGFDQYGALLRVNGKTGFRQVRIVGNSIAYLRAWLDVHPNRNNPDSWLFCGLGKENMNDHLLYPDVYAIIRRTVKRAGITRRIYPHLFRHTRATILADKVTEAPLESQMGWIHGSRQTRTYVHLSLRDQDNAILKAYGLEIKTGDIVKEARPKECPRCRQLNPSDAKYCRNCWLPFDIKEALEIEEKEKEMENAILKSGLDPLVKKVLETAPENAKLQLLVSLLEEISKEPAKLKDLRKNLS
jgi:site-specific recombinase XerD